MKYAAISINFDSLNEAYGFPSNYADPTFSVVFERFKRISDKYNFKFSIYVIGKDLLKRENREAVRNWYKEGHEIGNHSWSHPENLGHLSYDRIYKEVALADYIITKTIGKNPEGFIAPAWSSSPKLLSILNKMEYKYDHSIAPSWLMLLAVLKNAFNHLGSRKFRKIISRKDWLVHLFGNRNPQIIDNLIELPLPTNNFRIPCWHTLCFVFGWEIFEKILRSSLNEMDCFYYLVHPADLIDENDLDKDKVLYLDRLEYKLDEKIESIEKAIRIILESGREIITMKELSSKVEVNF